MKRYIFSLYDFFTDKLWKIPIEELSGSRKFFHKLFRCLVLSIYGIFSDAYFLRASSLTFYTLMSVVPILVMALAIAKGFGLQKTLVNQLIERFPEQKEVLSKLLLLAQNWLEETKEGLITIIGIVILTWSVIRVLSNIESSLNHIWRVKKSRTWIRRFTDFLSLMVLAPIFFFTANSFTLFIVKELQLFVKGAHPVVESAMIFSTQLIPMILLWLLFSLLYLVIPNTKVEIRAAIFGGVVAGTLFQCVQWAYIFFQVGATKYGAIYGSFAALPLFLAWLQVSWLIVLLGARFSYAFQNIHAFEYGWQHPFLNMRSKLLVSLWIMRHVIEAYIHKRELDRKKLQQKLHLPMTTIDDIINELIEAKLLVPIKSGPFSFVPTRSPEKIRINDIRMILMRKQQSVILPDSHLLRELKKELDFFDKQIESSDHNRLLQEIPLS